MFCRRRSWTNTATKSAPNSRQSIGEDRQYRTKSNVENGRPIHEASSPEIRVVDVMPAAQDGRFPATAHDTGVARDHEAHLGQEWPVEVFERRAEYVAPVVWQSGMDRCDRPEPRDVFVSEQGGVRRIERCHLFSNADVETALLRPP